MASQEGRCSKLFFSVCENIVFRFLIEGLQFGVRRISLGRKAFQFVHGRRVKYALEVLNNLRCRFFRFRALKTCFVCRKCFFGCSGVRAAVCCTFVRFTSCTFFAKKGARGY